MPTSLKRRTGRVPVATRPVAERLDQLQDLLLEMRGALDYQLRLIRKLRRDVDVLVEKKGRGTKTAFRPPRQSAGDHGGLVHENLP